MTSRHDYFACRAPEAIPDWFSTAGAELPLPPVNREDFDLEWIAAGHPPRPGVGIFTPDYRAAVARAVDDWQQENTLRNMRNKERRYFAWRVYYADQMVAAIPEDK